MTGGGQPDTGVSRLTKDEQGATAIVVALSLTVLMGFAGLAVDASLWYNDKRVAQGAADSAAFSGAVDLATGDSVDGVVSNARAISSRHGLINGVGGVIVAVNMPPTEGPNASAPGAVEVIITKQESRLFSSFFLRKAQIAARAVAIPGSSQGKYCAQALDPSSGETATVTNGAVLDASGCGIQVNGSGSAALSITGGATLKATTVSVVGNYTSDAEDSVVTSRSINRNAPSIADPYATVAMPAAGACTATSANYNGGAKRYAISPGTYCNGLAVGSGATLVMNPGVYVVQGGDFVLQKGSTVDATSGVTIVLTGSGADFATVRVSSGSALNLTAPTAGTTAGLAIMQDAHAPRNRVNTIDGGASTNITGALYFPRQTVKFSNGVSNRSDCTQLVAYDLVITSGTHLRSNCGGTGVRAIGAVNTALVE